MNPHTSLALGLLAAASEYASSAAAPARARALAVALAEALAEDPALATLPYDCQPDLLIGDCYAAS